MEKEYLSIKEFAAAADVSQQSIYKRLNKADDELIKFVKVIDKKKFIAAAALDIVYKLKEPLPQEKPQENNNYTETLLKLLQEQLDGQRKDIESKDKHIEELTKRLAEANQIIDQQQKLHLLDKQKILELEAATQEQQEQKSFFSFFKRKAKNNDT